MANFSNQHNASDAQSLDDQLSSALDGGSPPRDKVATGSTPPDDPRLAAFREYLRALDCHSTKAAIAASRELRRLGISVVVTSAGGGR